MLYKIEVKDKRGIFDAVGSGIKKDILDLGITSVDEVNFVQVYAIDGDISQEEIEKICSEILTDSISQDYLLLTNEPENHRTKEHFVVEVAYNPGVMDPVEESTLKAINDLGINTVNSVKTARKYLVYGKLNEHQLKIISEKLLYNKLIQHVVKPQTPGAQFKITPRLATDSS